MKRPINYRVLAATPLPREAEELTEQLAEYHAIPVKEIKKRIRALEELHKKAQDSASPLGDHIQAKICYLYEFLELQQKRPAYLLRLPIIQDKKFLTPKFLSKPFFEEALFLLDPLKRPLTELKHLHKTWLKNINEKTPDFYLWLEQQDTPHIFKKEYDINIDNNKVIFKDGIASNEKWSVNGALLNGYFLYNISLDGDLFIGHGAFNVANHSQVSAELSILCAGYIQIIDGKIVAIDNDSGHYKPTKIQLHRAILALVKKHGIDIFDDQAKVTFMGEDTEINIKDFINNPPQPNQLDKKSLLLSINDMWYLSKHLQPGQYENVNIIKITNLENNQYIEEVRSIASILEENRPDFEFIEEWTARFKESRNFLEETDTHFQELRDKISEKEDLLRLYKKSIDLPGLNDNDKKIYMLEMQLAELQIKELREDNLYPKVEKFWAFKEALKAQGYDKREEYDFLQHKTIKLTPEAVELFNKAISTIQEEKEKTRPPEAPTQKSRFLAACGK